MSSYKCNKSRFDINWSALFVVNTVSPFVCNAVYLFQGHHLASTLQLTQWNRTHRVICQPLNFSDTSRLSFSLSIAGQQFHPLRTLYLARNMTLVFFLTNLTSIYLKMVVVTTRLMLQIYPLHATWKFVWHFSSKLTSIYLKSVIYWATYDSWRPSTDLVWCYNPTLKVHEEAGQ